MKETYRDMKARHMRETGELSQSLRNETETIRKKELRAIAQRHHREIMEAWGQDQTGEAFVLEMMLDGAFFGLEMSDILEADNIALETPEDREKARHGYAMAMAYYDEHPNGLGAMP